ncbi:hypothetical protein MMAD_12930 [Mycolicibacterium madagascariense]|uniref:Uncharacterized protein n=1 Tax=Mycolicibacterium madagascariense TaxID=212765 RepID=A0A7I7XE82_9MYCO|nr:hypothetical protein MMAD_12930 [Mycolicibacterium madagascariense]
MIRPKSMATVVVCFDGVASRASYPSEAFVTMASVRSGMISETAPTKVVLPAPKPPEMTIFVADERSREDPEPDERSREDPGPDERSRGNPEPDERCGSECP